MKAYNRILSLILVSCMLSACGKEITEVSDSKMAETSDYVYGMLKEGEVSYEIPSQSPSIIVDLLGYESEETKDAIVVSENLPDSFVVKKANGDVVFTGTVKSILVTEDKEDGKLTGILDFTELTKTGTYFIEADKLGRSMDFEIVDDKMSLLVKNSFEALDDKKCTHGVSVPFEDNPEESINVSGGYHTDENGGKDLVTGCLTALDLMLAYEYHPEAFEDESGNKIPDILDEIKYETDWLLKMQNPITGGVYTSVSMQEIKGNSMLVVGGETTKATAYFATTLARFSYIYNKFDEEYSALIFKKAILAWNCIEANKDLISEEQRYRAAAELYRAIGYSNYHDVILNYLRQNSSKPYESRITLDAAISYLATKRYTNTGYCGNLMAAFMDRTEDKSTDAKNSRFMVQYKDMSVNEILRNTTELIVVDYIISNVEYEKLERNYIHYLSGRNEKSENLLDFGYDIDSYAELIVLASKLKGNQE